MKRIKEGGLYKPLEYIIDDNQCWIWQKQLVGKGYGRKWVDGKGVLAHIWYYKKHKGEYDSSLQLDHLCMVKKCVNPEHLEPVTGTVNKRRASKLNEASVRDIRSSKLSLTELANKYSVTVQCIWRVVNNRTWVGVA